MSFIPPTRGSLRCMCWQGYKGDTWEDYAEKREPVEDTLFDECNDRDCGYCDCLEHAGE